METLEKNHVILVEKSVTGSAKRTQVRKYHLQCTIIMEHNVALILARTKHQFVVLDRSIFSYFQNFLVLPKKNVWNASQICMLTLNLCLPILHIVSFSHCWYLYIKHYYLNAAILIITKSLLQLVLVLREHFSVQTECFTFNYALCFKKYLFKLQRGTCLQRSPTFWLTQQIP